MPPPGHLLNLVLLALCSHAGADGGAEETGNAAKGRSGKLCEHFQFQTALSFLCYTVPPRKNLFLLLKLLSPPSKK